MPLYPINTTDQFWSAKENGNANPLSKSMNIQKTVSGTGTGGPFNAGLSSALRLDAGLSHAPTYVTCIPPSSLGTFVVYTRKFVVCNGGTVDINAIFAADFFVREATLSVWNQAAGTTNVVSNLPLGNCGCKPCTNTNQNICSINQTGLVLNPGIYFLSFTVDNDASVCLLASGATDMWFELEGNIVATAGVNVFKDNRHEGDYTQKYPLDDVSNLVINGNPCVNPLIVNIVTNTTNATGAPTTTTNVLNPNLTYELFNPNTNSTSVLTSAMLPLTLTTPGLYNLKMTDIYGCYRQTFLSVTAPGVVTASPAQQCVNTTGSVTITPKPANATWTYSLIKFNGSTTTTTPTPTLNVLSGLGLGSYTLTVTDATSGCAASTVFKIGKNFSCAVTSSDYCLLAPGTATLTVVTNPVPTALNPYSYVYSGPGVVSTTPSGSATINAAGTYTLIVTDAFGCTATSTAYIQKKATIITTVSPPCLSPGSPPLLTCSLANGWASPTFAVSLNNGGSAVPTVPSSYQLFATVSPTLVNVGVLAVPANYCPPTASTYTLISCPTCVLPTVITILACSTTPAGTNVSSFGGGFAAGIWPTTPILITGHLKIDVKTLAANNPKIFLAANAKITIMPGLGSVLNRMTIDNCTISTCDVAMSDGIYLPGPQFTDLIVKNSIISDMKNGIVVNNACFIKATNNQFINNGTQSIKFDGCNSGYSNVITGNTFKTVFPLPSANTPNPTLLPPFIYYPAGPNTVPFTIPMRSEMGIVMNNSEPINIGVGPSNTIVGNTFDNLDCGIKVQAFSGINAQPYQFSNNIFTNIRNHALSGSTNQPYWAIQSPISSHLGAGIYFNGTSSFGNIAILGDQTTTHFDLCDKAIVIQKAKNIDVSINTIKRTFMGIQVFNTKETTQIAGNTLNNTNLGIYCYETMSTPAASTYPNYLKIYRNIVKTNSAGIIPPGPPGTNYIFPQGISVHQTLNTYFSTSMSSIFNNTVELNSPKGLCFKFTKANNFLQVSENTARILNTTTTAANGYSAPFAVPPIGELGFWVDNCLGAQFSTNAVKGNFTNTNALIHNSAGFHFLDSKNLTVKCNHITNTVRGFNIAGNCTDITNTNINTNCFNANKYPWFSELGVTSPIGTFGNVGFPLLTVGMAAGQDNRNEFYNPLNIPSWTTQPANDWRFVAGGIPRDIVRITSALFSTDKVYSNNATYVSQGISSSQPSNTFCSACPLAARYTIANNTGLNFDLCTQGPSAAKMLPDPIVKEEDPEAKAEVDENIAEVPLNYTTNEALLKWLDKYTLFATLHQDAAYRNANADLLSYYNSMQTSNIAKFYYINNNLTALQHMAVDSPDFVLLVNQIQTANLALMPNSDWEQAEKDLNAIIINNITNFVNSYEPEQLEFITDLAYTCPNVLGNAVYKARGLFASLDPTALYDDRVICSTNGERNSGIDSSNLSYDDKMEQRLTAEQIKLRTEAMPQGSINIYPNPASEVLNIDYKCDAEDGRLYIFNTLGLQVHQVLLPHLGNTLSTSITGIPNGVYLYKAVFAGCGTVAGKLVIKK